MTRRMDYQRPRRPCACCGKVGPIRGYGYRQSCYRRWIAAGKPPEGPPPPHPISGGGRPRGERDSYIEEFAFVRATRTNADGDPISVEDTAAVIGVSTRTAWRYHTALRTQPTR